MSTHDSIDVSTIPFTHVVVWLDHHEARVYAVGAEDSLERTLAAPRHNIHHRHPQSAGKAHPEELQRYLHDVARALTGAKEILIVGPSTAKLELVRHLHRHDPELERRVVGVETVDHPTDRQLVAHARAAFLAVDRMR